LRQAPNVILVGEMRDYETASMGIQASLTGHLVFSTLHTNDAPGAVTRMIDMGVPSYLVSGSVIGILAQRLVRVICSKCKQPHTPRPAELEAAGITPEQAASATFMKGRGCNNCGQVGYLRAADDDLQDPRARVSGRLHSGYPERGSKGRHVNTLRRRNS
jgi:type IV pilus assembly protein PilB